MMATSITYFLIQVPALPYAIQPKKDMDDESGSTVETDEPKVLHEKTYALVAMILSSTLFFLYCFYQLHSADAATISNDKAAKQKKMQIDQGERVLASQLCQTTSMHALNGHVHVLLRSAGLS